MLEEQSGEPKFGYCKCVGLAMCTVCIRPSLRTLADSPYRDCASEPFSIWRGLYKGSAVKSNMGEPPITEFLTGFWCIDDMLCRYSSSLFLKNELVPVQCKLYTHK